MLESDPIAHFNLAAAIPPPHLTTGGSQRQASLRVGGAQGPVPPEAVGTGDAGERVAPSVHPAEMPAVVLSFQSWPLDRVGRWPWASIAGRAVSAETIVPKGRSRVTTAHAVIPKE